MSKNIANLTVLIPFLAELNTHAKKSLSQNFLVDNNILDKIIKLAQIDEQDIVLEIGPGPGALTQKILLQKSKVIAVEKDTILSQALNRLKTEKVHLEIYNQDICDFAIEDVIQAKLKENQKAKVLSNLPYQLTSTILSLFLPLYPLFSSLTFMVQEEVARRIVAKSNTEDYSSLSILTHIYSNPSYGFKVKRGCFYPIPKVDSAVVHLELKKPPQICLTDFFKMTRTAFQHRRKMLRASLKDLYAPQVVEHALESLGLSPKSRPEEISLENLISLFELLQKK